MFANYIFVYDYTEIEVDCEYDEISNEVFNIEPMDETPDGECIEEYINLFDGRIIKTFYNRDEDIHIQNGVQDLELTY